MIDEKPLLLVTLPAYNEAPRLESTVNRLTDVLGRAGIRYRLAIAEDGSTDGTPELLQRLQKHRPELLVQSLSERMGRGYALRVLWNTVEADVYSFTDVDLATTPESLLAGLEAIYRGADVVTGSRYVAGSVVVRPPFRSFASRFYNWLIRLMFRDEVRDHQCGMKLFTSDAAARLLPLTSEDSWFWDTEILLWAKKLGMRVDEIPVYWTERKAKRTEVVRLISDVYIHGTGLIKIKSALDHRSLDQVARPGTSYDSLGGRDRVGIYRTGGKITGLYGSTVNNSQPEGPPESSGYSRSVGGSR